MPTHSLSPRARGRRLPWPAGLAAAVALAVAFAVVVADWTLRAAPSVGAAGDCTVAAADLAVDGEEQRLLDLINQYRAQHGLGAWKLSPALTRAAAWKSRDMAANNYLAHADRDGRDIRTRQADCGYNVTGGWGENIAAGTSYDAAQRVLTVWQGSPTHDALLRASAATV